MKQRLVLSALPFLVVASPALAQAPAPVAPVPAPAEPAPAVVALPSPDAPVLAPGTAPVAAPAPVVPPAPAVTDPEKETAPPDRLTIAKTGFFQPSALLQVWGFASHLGGVPDNEWQTTFRARRAELRIKGEIIPKTFGYLIMVDAARLLDFQNRTSTVEDAEGNEIGSVTTSQPPSGGNTSLLQDIAVTYMTEYADVSIGQFKIPVSLEGAGSSSKLYFPERALVSRRYGDRRDLGLRVEKKLERFGYTLGVYNGEGQNKLDSNDQKDVALRLEVYPIKDVTLAAVGYVAVGDRDLPGTKDRVEGDVKVERDNVLLQAEYIRGWDRGATDRVQGHGIYVLAGYTFFDRLQPVVRIGSLDPEIGEDEQGDPATDPNDEFMTYEFGANYYVKQHDVKFQLAGGFFDPEQASARTRFDLTLAAQVAF